MLTQVFLGGHLLPLDPKLLEAVAQLTTGNALSPDQANLLLAVGILVDTNATAAEELTWGVITHGSQPHPMAETTPERVVPAPTVAIGLEQPARRLAGNDEVLPTSSLPIAMFVPPRTLAPLQRLAGILRRSWFQLMRNAQARGVVVDPDDARGVFERLVREAHSSDPELQRLVSLEEPFALAPREPLQNDDIHYPFAAITLRTDREPSAAELLATGSSAARVPMLSDDALGACGRLLGLLNAGLGPAEIAAFLAESPDARPLFGQLVALGLLAPAPNRRHLGDQIPPGTIAHLGHATLLANLGGDHVLIDPWLPPSSRADGPPPPAVAELPALAAIVITHHHWDHVHAETLLQLDKRVPIYVPAPDRTRPLVVETERLLRYLGFSDVRALNVGDEIELGDSGRIVAAPFHGEDPTRLGYRGLCYVLVHDGAAALVHVDSGPDASGTSMVSSGDAERLAKAHGPLSPVFATRRQERGTMVEHPWEFLLAPPDAWPRPTENCDTGSAFLADLAARCGASCLALYSEGGAPWYPAWTNFLRPGAANAGAEPYEYLWEPLDEIVAAVRARGTDVQLSQPYDRYRIGGGPDGAVTPRRDPGSL